MPATVEIQPISNRADWKGAIYLIDEDTGDPIDATGLTDLKIELEDPSTRTSELVGSYVDGTVVAIDLSKGTFTFTFRASETNKLTQQWYWFAGTFIRDEDTAQLFRVSQNTYYGVVG